MNFSKLFASLALATVATVSPAFASTGNEVTNGQRALWNTIEAQGTTINVGECEETDAYGWFNSRTNRIVICTNVATDVDTRWETLRHEAVHLAQRCENPSMESTLLKHQWLFNNGLQSDWSFIQEAYDQEDHMIELEAFTLMRESNQTIAAVVNRACN